MPTGFISSGALVALAAIIVFGCARVERPRLQVVPTLEPDALRSEVARRVPELDPSEIVAPYAVDSAVVERARLHVESARGAHNEINSLVGFLTDDVGLGLTYDFAALGNARETIASGRGNCLSLAFVLVGVARQLGWRAVFVEMQLEEPAQVLEADLLVTEEHMAVRILHGGVSAVVDYSGQLDQRSKLRNIGDLRATAQYFINRAYSEIASAHRQGQPVAWAEVERKFEIATRLAPDLPSAWNNLGVAQRRLGQFEAAERAYNRSIELDDDNPVSHRNLARLRALQANP